LGVHLYSVTARREAETVRRLVAPSGPKDLIAEVLGCGQFAWIGLCLPTDRLLGREYSSIPGDVDLLGGPLHPGSQAAWDEALLRRKGHPYIAMLDLAVSGGIAWPPVLDDMGAAEVKVVRCEVGGRTRRRGLGAREQGLARRQALGLCELGFDRIALLRVVVSPPACPCAGSPWLVAGSIASRAARRYARDVHTTASDPFCTAVLALGAVASATEDNAGSLGCVAAENLRANPLRALPLAQVNRRAMEGRLREAFLARPRPLGAPLFVLACARAKRCGEFFVTNESTTGCPRCGGPSTAMTV
jgi:hypothetical protein